MLLARVIHVDDSDRHVFACPARTGEWAISGGWEFSNWTQADLTGKPRQAFANGWLGLESWGRATFIAVTRIQPDEYAALETALADHFVAFYGAPDRAVALPTAQAELAHMADLCADHDPNTVLAIARELTPAGVRETYHAIRAQAAQLDQFAIHASPDD